MLRTTNGDIDSSLAGIILPHEHLIIDFRGGFSDYGTGLLWDPEDATPYVSEYAYLSSLPAAFNGITGRTIVDVSTRGLREELYSSWRCTGHPSCTARDSFHNLLATREYPVLLDDVSYYSGPYVVMGTGEYRHGWERPGLSSLTTNQIRDLMVSDIVSGVDGTSVRAGIIGEIGISGTLAVNGIDTLEKRVLIAACRAQTKLATEHNTSVAISLHMPPPKLSELDGILPLYGQVTETLEASGCADPFTHNARSRIVFGHFLSASGFVLTADDKFHLAQLRGKMAELAGHGYYLEFDLFGNTEESYIEDGSEVARLIDNGLIDRILVSQDIYNWDVRENTGYAYILKNLTSWFGAARPQVSAPSAPLGTVSSSNVLLADVNHDGMSDLVVRSGSDATTPGQIYLGLGTAQGFTLWTWVSNVRVSNTAKVWLADVNGDSKADLVVQGGPTDVDHGQIYVALSTGTAFSMWTTGPSSVRLSDNARAWLADVNADDKADLVVQGGAADTDHGQTYVALSTGTSFSMWTSGPSNVRVSNAALGKVQLADVNGDRKADLVVVGGPGDYDHGQVYVALSTGSQFGFWNSGPSAVRLSDTAKVMFADVDGDTKADLIAEGGANDPDHGQFYVARSLGSAFEMWTSGPSSLRVSNSATVWVADVDGDTKADLISKGGATDPDRGQLSVALSNATGTGFERWSTHTTFQPQGLVGDDSARVWLVRNGAGKALGLLNIPTNSPTSPIVLKSYAHPVGHPIGVSASDMKTIMVDNARRVLEIPVSCP